MSCHANAFLADATNSGGTAWRDLMACRSAAKSSSSSRPLVTALTFHLAGFGVPRAAVRDSGHVRGTAQPVQAAGPHGADAAYRHSQGRAYVRVGAALVT